MELKNSQYQEIMRGYERKRFLSHDLQTRRYEEVYKKVPEFKALDESISILSVQYAKRLLNGDDGAVSSLKEELAILRNRKQKLLKSAGFQEDYLEPVYECSDCKDTGYINGKKCHCFKREISRLLYNRSNLSQVLSLENFNTFSLDYYSSNFIDPKSGRSAKEVMQEAYVACREFVRTFQTEYRNLFLYGDVGVGKTFLSNCIAGELIEAGYSVLYFSAPALFNALAHHTFDKNDTDAHTMYEFIFDCDLLIIDDLGTEYTNSFISSQFFSCINERLLSRKSTVISTNLSLDSLADLYTERSFSRIMSNYIMLKIIGDDIRIKKKLQHKEEQQ